MLLHRRTRAMLLVLSLSSALIACSSSGKPATTVAPPGSVAPASASTDAASGTSTSVAASDSSVAPASSTTDASAAAPQSADISVLVAAGLSIVPREDQPVDPSI